MSSSSTIRHDLVLPNELLHKIILWVLCDGVHSICTSTGDTSWEKSMMTVLHQVSPAFKAISSEIAAKAFDLSRDVRNDDAAVSHALREEFVYLSLVGAKFRHPSDWEISAFQTINCSASPFAFAYALYLSCTALRRNVFRSQRDVFESLYKVMLSAIDQSEALCHRVKPAEITWSLRECLHQERELVVIGLDIVEGFHDLYDYSEALCMFQNHAENDGSGPVIGARHFIHKALSRIEGSYEKYEDILNRHPSEGKPRAYELPGVIRGVRRLATLTVDDDQFDLRERIRKVVEVWSAACPAVNKADGVI